MQFYKCKRKKKYFLSYPFRIAPLHPRLPKFHNVQNAPGLTSSANKTAPTSFAPPTSQISQCSKCHMFAELTKRNVCKSFFTWKLFVQGFIRANLCGMCFFYHHWDGPQCDWNVIYSLSQRHCGELAIP